MQHSGRRQRPRPAAPRYKFCKTEATELQNRRKATEKSVNQCNRDFAEAFDVAARRRVHFPDCGPSPLSESYQPSQACLHSWAPGDRPPPPPPLVDAYTLSQRVDNFRREAEQTLRDLARLRRGQKSKQAGTLPKVHDDLVACAARVADLELTGELPERLRRTALVTQLSPLPFAPTAEMASTPVQRALHLRGSQLGAGGE